MIIDIPTLQIKPQIKYCTLKQAFMEYQSKYYLNYDYAFT